MWIFSGVKDDDLVCMWTGWNDLWACYSGQILIEYWFYYAVPCLLTNLCTHLPSIPRLISCTPFHIYTGILKFVWLINNIVVQAESGQFYHLDMPFAPTHTYWAVKLCYVNSNCNFYSCTFSIVSNKHVATVAEAFTLMISTLLFYKNIQYRQFELEK